MSTRRQGPSTVPLQNLLALLEAVGEERTVSGMLGRTVQQIESLLRFDHACVTLSTVNFWKPGLIFTRHSSIWQDYFHHYSSLRTLPSRAEPWWPSVGVINPEQFGDIEFHRDFAATHHIRQTLVLTNLPQVTEGSQGFCFGFFRCSKTVFSAEDLACLKMLYPHLRNLFSLLVEPTLGRRQRLERNASRSGLTRREVEVVELLCERLSVAEIADRLFISRHTVEKHLENIYAKLRAAGWRKACEEISGDEAKPQSTTSTSPMFL